MGRERIFFAALLTMTAAGSVSEGAGSGTVRAQLALSNAVGAPGAVAPSSAAPADGAPLARNAPAQNSLGVPESVHAARVSEAIHVDARMATKRAWDSDLGGTGIFRDASGQGLVPYSEARARWHDGTLYLWLYAGDLDLEGRAHRRDADLAQDDAFHLEFGAGRVYAIDVSLLGVLSDAICSDRSHEPGPRKKGECDRRWQSHASVAVDRDGSLNRVHDNDEEWLVELALPLKNLGLRRVSPGTRIPFSVSRCEIGHDGRHACGGFGLTRDAWLVLDP